MTGSNDHITGGRQGTDGPLHVVVVQLLILSPIVNPWKRMPRVEKVSGTGEV